VFTKDVVPVQLFSAISSIDKGNLAGADLEEDCRRKATDTYHSVSAFGSSTGTLTGISILTTRVLAE
jgi:hypothetical protein